MPVRLSRTKREFLLQIHNVLERNPSSAEQFQVLVHYFRKPLRQIRRKLRKESIK